MNLIPFFFSAPEELGLPDTVRFRQSLLMGYISSPSEVGRAIDMIRPEFPEDGYSIVFKNCNDFSNRLCQTLLGKYLLTFAIISKYSFCQSVSQAYALIKEWQCVV